MPIEKLIYTNGEKAAEITAAVITAGSVAGYIALFALGKTSGVSMILIVVSLILYTALTLCSAFPQHTNVAMNPEKCSEKKLRTIRRACIAAKIVLIGLMFAMAVVDGFLV